MMERPGSLPDPMSSKRPGVLIVGGGFAGLAAAKALAGAPVDVTVVDRRNHHVFQPLLYQVATASLSPADISSPIRTILRGQENCQVVLGEVTGVDVARRHLILADGPRPLRLPGARRRSDARLLRPRRLGGGRSGPEEHRGRDRAAPAHPAGLRVGRVRGQRRSAPRGAHVRDRRGRADRRRARRRDQGDRRPDAAARLQAHRHAHDPRRPPRGRRARAARVPAGLERPGAA